MSFYLFLLLSLALNGVLCLFVRFRRYRLSLFLPLFGLAFVFPLQSFLGSVFFDSAPGVGDAPWILRLYCSSCLASTVLLAWFIQNFFRAGESRPAASFMRPPYSFALLLEACGILAAAACLVFPFCRQLRVTTGVLAVINPLGDGIVSVQLVIVVYSIYVLENTYRFAQEYQRKIARLSFLGLLVLLLFQLYFAGHLLLYRFLDRNMVVVAAVAYGVTYPVMLAGLLRYRLGTERISIPRNAVFSTVSLLLSGAAFTGVGLTVIVFKKLHLDFGYFEQTLLVFTLCLFAVLTIGSGTMRKRIATFMNNYFYTQKFDYREQFYNLHRSYMTGENVEMSLTEIIENMKYAAAADDAFIFLLNDADGNLYMHQNKESSTAPDCVIGGDSRIVRELSKSLLPMEIKPGPSSAAGKEDETDELLHSRLKADILFPVVNRGQLLGILALRTGKTARIGIEETALIEAFANSIGDVLFKNKVLTERVERKQFESFSHLSSFIVHDIKNQTATLSLLVGNAGKNLNNPDFQKSLLLSLQSCASSLTALVDKLKSPPRPDALTLRLLSVNAVVDRVIENSGMATLDTVALVLEKGAVPDIECDEESLFYTVKNLVVNALEAMNRRGTLSIVTGPLVPSDSRVLDRFDVGTDFLAPFRIYIMVSDTGCGMTRDFMEKKLFHPFATTKDKGIGIGLYQCKTLIEKMNGKILCRSEKGKGSDFCILL
jgi:hypothetical protein